MPDAGKALLHKFNGAIGSLGRKFVDAPKLFDHTAHNGANYLKGHCFVSVMLCMAVWNIR